LFERDVTVNEQRLSQNGIAKRLI